MGSCPGDSSSSWGQHASSSCLPGQVLVWSCMWHASQEHAQALERAAFLLLLCFVQINVVMDYANGGSLFEYVQARTKLPEALAR